MSTGGLETKIGEPALAKVKEMFAGMKTADMAPYDPKRGKMAELGKIVIEQGPDGSLKWSTHGNFGLYAKYGDDVQKLIADLMSNNGQLDYIKAQDWFTSKEFDVVIDVNYYIDRPIDSRLGFHKDTGGTNLFVNLVFDNSETIPGTEWTQDRLLPAEKRMELLQKWMPASMLDSITEAKSALKSIGAPGRNTIQGGRLPPYAFVSWVDELVWHSTPLLDHRAKITNPKEYAQQAIERRLEKGNTYKVEREALVEKFYKATTEAEQREINAQLTALDKKNVLRLAALEELAVAIATTPGTHLGTFLKDKGYSPEIEGYDAQTMLDALSVYEDKTYPKFGLKKTLAEDLDKVAWNELPGFFTQIGISNDSDPNVPGSRQIRQATGIGNRPRVNSTLMSKKDPNNLKTLAEKSSTRTFLRTWVRVEKKVQRRVIDAVESVSPEKYFDESTGKFLAGEFDAWYKQQFPDSPPVKLESSDFDRINDILSKVIESIRATGLDESLTISARNLLAKFYMNKGALLTALVDRLATSQRPTLTLMEIAKRFPPDGAIEKDNFKQWVDYWQQLVTS